MAKYRKKPVEIEAFEFCKDFMKVRANCKGVPDWGISAYDDGVIYFDDKDECFIKTLEGDHHVSVGDYIIQGVKGELYPCKPDIFEATYEKVWPLSPLLEKQNVDVGSMTDEEWKKHLDGLKCQSE